MRSSIGQLVAPVRAEGPPRVGRSDEADDRQPRDRVEFSGDPAMADLTEEERREVEQLKERDAEVRTHEQAHVAAAGSLFRGGPTYDLTTGPDGKRYAVGGSVKIDTSEAEDPEATIVKARKIRQAALAPAEPSSTDRAVAAKASRMEANARQELAEAQQDEKAEADDGSASRERDVGSLVDVLG